MRINLFLMLAFLREQTKLYLTMDRLRINNILIHITLSHIVKELSNIFFIRNIFDNTNNEWTN